MACHHIIGPGISNPGTIFHNINDHMDHFYSNINGPVKA